MAADQLESFGNCQMCVIKAFMIEMCELTEIYTRMYADYGEAFFRQKSFTNRLEN